jgi:general secretion pathway protein N
MLVVSAALAAGLAVEIERPPAAAPMPATTAPGAGHDLPQTSPAFIAPAQDAFAEIGARPIFAATRRPPPKAPPRPPPAPAAAAPPPPAPSPPPVAANTIVVQGIVGAPAARIALLRPPNAPAVVKVVEGDQVAGWHVARILTDRVVLQWNATEEEISFPKPGERSGASAATSSRSAAENRKHP